jgi:2'-5' RNA ligase
MPEKVVSDEVAEDVKDDLLVKPNFPAAPGQPDPKLKPRLPTRTSSELVSRDCAVSKTANHRGCMVALRVPMTVANVIAMPGGEPASDLHVTLAYLGDADEIEPERVSELIERIKTICAHTPPLEGTISGYGRFRDAGGDDQEDPGVAEDVLWVGYDSPDLPELRHRVVQACADAALPLAGDHGFTPHITLAYVAAGEGEDPTLPAIACEMRWVSVVFGTTETQLRLAGDPHDPADKRPQQPLPQSTVSALMQPAETYTSLYDLEAWAVGRGDLIVRADVDGQPAVIVKKGSDLHVGVLGWEAPLRLDDLVVAFRRIAHDYVLSGKIIAKDIMGRWLSRDDLGAVLTGETVATPIFFPSDVLVLDGDVTGHTAAERWELLRGLVPEAGGHVVVPPQLPCGVEDDLERVVDQAMAWRPSEGEGIRVLAVDVLPADSSYEHGLSRALARLSLAEGAAKEAFGYGAGPGERPDWREHVPEERLTEPNFAKPEKKSVLSDVDDGDDTDSGHPTRKYSDEEQRDEHGRWAAWATAHGGTFNGVQEGGPRTADHALITDHHTGSTGAIPVPKMSEEAVRAKLLQIRARFAADANAHRDMTHKDGAAAGVFGTPGTSGILAPEQGVFRKPRRSQELNSAWELNKDFGDNVSIGVPLTMVPTRPTGPQRRRPKHDAGGPVFPHYVGPEGDGVSKELWSGQGNYAGDGDSFPTVFGSHRFVVGRLRDGQWEADPEFKRVNPYEAIFQRKVALLKVWSDEAREAAAEARRRGAAAREQAEEDRLTDRFTERMRDREQRLRDMQVDPETEDRVRAALGMPARADSTGPDPATATEPGKPKWRRSKNPMNEYGYAVEHGGASHEVYWDQGSAQWRSHELLMASGSGGSPVDYVGHNKADVNEAITSGALAAKLRRYSPVRKDVQHAVGGESPDARKPRKYPDVGEDMGFNDSYDSKSADSPDVETTVRGVMWKVQEPELAVVTKREATGVDGKVRLRDCYRQAAYYAAFGAHRDVSLVHGTITVGDPGVRVGHGWAEFKSASGVDVVYDGVQGQFYVKSSYYERMRAVPEQTYDADEARTMMLKHEHFGPWGPCAGL